MARILIIDDDPAVATGLRVVLISEGYEVEIATTVEEGLALAQAEEFEVVVTDLHWDAPGSRPLDAGTGIKLIEDLHRTKPQVPIVLITARPTTDTTIGAIKAGAFEYVTKPSTNEKEMEEFLAAVRKAAESYRRGVETVHMGKEINSWSEDAIVGRSRVMQDVYKEIGRVAAKPVTVLIRGETGTGKELVARAIKQHSDRAAQPFVVVNCAAIPETLLESELFGHEPGAFTDAKVRRIGRFEQAEGGTIFLDEIGDMSLSTQVKLLRVLQEKSIQRLGGVEPIPVDVRVLAATHRILEAAIQEKQFRSDLYYRLNDAVIMLPPLRDRREDIPDLVDYFMRRYGPQLGAVSTTMPEDAIPLLQEQAWPGNVRELRNVVRKALILARKFPVTKEIVAEVLKQTTMARPTVDQSLSSLVAEVMERAERGETHRAEGDLMDVVERELYSQAIRLARNDQSKAARWLGVSRPTMRDKLIRYGLHPTQAAESVVPEKN
ncbi:MAG: sigma-54 dependent transcriptional regulator [Verrucomicrobia subdivision 3 bacterium]|nr:sigma-54 dependent transcriptional regulator [Limisphaerales bacterium]